MFGAICAGQPVQTNLQTISETQFAFLLPVTPVFHHLVVFLIPGQSLPLDTAAGVYIQFPGKSEFKFLGAIGNEKQSAIFKVNNVGKPIGNAAVGAGDEVMAYETAPGAGGAVPGAMEGNIVLGISVEPASNINAQLASMQSAPTNAGTGSTDLIQKPVTTKVLAQRIIRDAFNFLASFTNGQGGDQLVPLRIFQDWWSKFEKRLERDPGFLDRDDTA